MQEKKCAVAPEGSRVALSLKTIDNFLPKSQKQKNNQSDNPKEIGKGKTENGENFVMCLWTQETGNGVCNSTGQLLKTVVLIHFWGLA